MPWLKFCCELPVTCSAPAGTTPIAQLGNVARVPAIGLPQSLSASHIPLRRWIQVHPGRINNAREGATRPELDGFNKRLCCKLCSGP